MDMPELIYPSVQMPLFFFVSGTFYHAKSSTLFGQLKSDAYKLILPALVFSLFAYVIGKSMGAMNGSVYENVINSLSASIVWFLIALFYFRTIAYCCVCKGRSIVILLISLVLYVPGYYLYAKGMYWVLPFLPLSHMGTFMIWFALGLQVGGQILKLITSSNAKLITLFIAAAVLYIIVVHMIDWNVGILSHIPWLLYGFPYTFGVIFVMIVIAKKVEKVALLIPANRFLSYIGRNSIVFYLTHWPLWIYVFKQLGWNKYLAFLLIVLLEVPLIYIFNHYLPWCIGKTKK